MGATFRPDRSAIRPLMEDAMGRRRLAILALLVLVVSLPAPVAAQTKDDTLVYAIQSDMQNWDPPNSVLRESIILGYHVFDHLAARDLKTGKVGPSLATAWRNLDDTTWEVRLRPGVRFHDGTPFTARDVKASFAVLGASLGNMIVVLGVAGWPIYARVVRAETMVIREREFILAGRALGMSHARIIFRQILPNLVSPIVVIATLQVAQVIVLESFLSFLGLGVQPPTPAWGNMLGEGRVYMLNSWWIAAFPGLAIFLTTLAINLMGNALRDWLDPHMKL